MAGALGGTGWTLIVTIVPVEMQPNEIFVALIVTVVPAETQPANISGTLIVTIVPAEIPPLEFFEVTVYVPGSTRVNIPVVLVQVELSMLQVIPISLGVITVIVPVVTRHVGCINVTVGAASVEDCVVIITLADADEVHPPAQVTVKLYVPAFKPDIVVLVPVPVIPPGFTVHVPVSGKPFNTTLPVSTTLVGCVIVDTIGATGAPKTALTVKGVAVDTHTELLVVTL